MALTDTAPPLSWDGTSLRVLDQTRLPGEEVVLDADAVPTTPPRRSAGSLSGARR